MSKHRKNKKSKPIKKFILIILLLIVFISTVYIVKNKISQNKDDKEQEEISKALEKINIDKNDITENITERMLQVKELQEVNSDVIGWLEIDGTNINYPVCQTYDNNYYLKHTYKKEKNSSGSLFLDKDYDFSIPSENLLIYGHRNKKGLMFDELVKYKDEEFYKKHPTIRFTTNLEDSEFEIISVFYSRVYYKNDTNVFRYYNFVNAETGLEFKEFVNNAKKASLYETNKTASLRRTTHDTFNM